MEKKVLEDLLANVENKDEIVNKIFAEYGKEVNKLRADLEESKGKVLSLENEKSELNQKLDGYKDYDSIKKSNEELTKQIEDNKLAQEKQIKDNAMNEIFKTSNVKDARALKGFIDETKLTWDEEKKTWNGLTEQLEELKKDSSYLFNEHPLPKNVNPTDGADGVSAETLALRNL